jgi:HlyD family secretion protein
MEQNKLFRQAAIDKMSSPERLDVLMEVTSPKGWLALWTVGGMLIIWSIFGSIPTRIEGQGILIRGGSLRELASGIDGELKELKVDIGGTVSEGQIVAVLGVANREDAADAARLNYENLQREHEAASAEDQATIAGYRATIAGHRADRERAADELRRKKEELPGRKEQLAKGIITRARVDQLEREIRMLESELTQRNASVNSLNAQINASEQRVRQRELQVDAAKQEFERLAEGNIRDTELKSPVAGRVVSVSPRVGDLVRRGEVVAMVEPESATMEPIVYIPSTQGGRVRPEMVAEISPTTVKREEYGFMKGKVRIVSQFPVSIEQMSSTVGNAELARELLGNASKIEIRAALLPTNETPSGYEWSSSTGPPFGIESGTRVSVSILVDRRAPISYVLPIIRGSTGI